MLLTTPKVKQFDRFSPFLSTTLISHLDLFSLAKATLLL